MSDTQKQTDALAGSDETTCSASLRELAENLQLWGTEYVGKPVSLSLFRGAAILREVADRREDRWTIEAFKAATNTIMSALVRKWEAEGERCGEEGRNSDEAWDADGEEWRERRAVYFECAEELKAALRKFSSQNA